MAVAAVHIEGLKELNRALDKVNKGLKKELRDALKDAAEPVRDSAERLAVARIRNIGATWPRMRIGATNDAVYMVPKTRRGRGHNMLARPNLAPLLFERAMSPALEKHTDELAEAAGKAFENVARQAGF